MDNTTSYPKSIPYIISNEAAERFSFYGMSAILPTFLVAQFFNPTANHALATVAEARANEKIHLFVTLAYFLPLIAGALADWFFGKYKVILYVSIVYCFGHLLLSIFDTDVHGFNAGLIFIAIGAGGIKACVSANVGDQFTEKNQHLISKVYGWFYFGINLGSILSTICIPSIYKYFGPKWAFGIPGIFMALATLIFYSGRKTYIKVPPSGMRRANFVSVNFFVVKAWLSGKRNAWPLAIQRFSWDAVDGVQAVWRVIVIMLFIPIFWSMWYQSLSEWVLQATKLDRHLFGYELLPEQVQSFNPLFILICIPLFTYIVYPFLERRGIKITPLRKIGAGLFFVGLSFVVVAMLQTQIDGGARPSVWWQILAYLVLTFSEVLISVTCLEYAYTQAPPAMKSTMTAVWWLTLSAGNLFTAMINNSIANHGIFRSFVNARFYWLFVAILTFFLIIYLAVASSFKEKSYLSGQNVLPNV